MTNPSIREFERDGRVFVIAEIGQAHDGSLGILHSFIDACAETGINAIKVQVHIADAESSDQEPFRTKFSYVDSSRLEYWKRMSFSEEQWLEVKRHCEACGIEFLATPFSIAAVELLERLNVNRYKIGSGDITNGLLLERIAATEKEVILSTGLAEIGEISNAVNRFRENGVSILQCTTKYPTSAEDIGLAAIGEIKAQFQCPAGLSDHSGKIYSGIAATALGASIYEAHVTFDRRMFGPDSKASLTIAEFSQLVEGIRFTESARSGTLGKTIDAAIMDLREMFGRTLAVNRDLDAGHLLMLRDLEAKKPAGMGIPADQFENVIGRRLLKPIPQWAFLTENHLGNKVG